MVTSPHTYPQSLKALTLARAGKAEESSSLCDEVIVQKPTEDTVLAALSHSLRALGRRMFDAYT